MKDNQIIFLYMNDGVECGQTRHIHEAYKMLQECKRLDKEEHIKGNEYYFILQEETEKAFYIQKVSITRRHLKNGNIRYYMKEVEE